jgi:hypothetical protein
MGRIEKLKRQAILEANQRILKEQDIPLPAPPVADNTRVEPPYHWTGLKMGNSTDVFTMSSTDPWEYVVVKTRNSSNLDPNDPIDDEEGLNTTSTTYYTRKKGEEDWIDISNSNADMGRAIEKINDYVSKNNLNFDKPGIRHKRNSDDGSEWMEEFEDTNPWGI